MRHVIVLVMVMAGVAWGDQPGVLVVPFQAVGEGAGQWMGRAVGQNLVTELGRVRSVRVVTAQDVGAVEDAAGAIKAGRELGAAYVVFGTCQVVDWQLRITGQVVEVETGEIVGGLKATGTTRDLFGLEDVIAEQTKRILMQRTRPATRPVEAPAPVIEARGPVRVEQAPWQRDVGWIARQQQWAMRDRERERAEYAYRYTYPVYPYYWSGYPVGYVYHPAYLWGYGRSYRSSFNVSGVYTWPGGMIRVGN